MGKLAELEKKKSSQGLTPEEEKLYNFLNEQKKERQKILTPTDKNQFNVSIGGLLGGGREPEQKPAENKPVAGQTQNSSTQKMKTCKKCGSEIPEEAKFCRFCNTDVDEYYKQQTEKTRLESLGTGGKLLESLKGGLKGKANDLKGKTLGEVKNRLDTAQSHVMNNVKFSIYFPIAILSVFRLLVPTVEGYVGTTIVPNYVQNLMWSSWPIILAGLFGVALPPSIILGKSGVNFDALNKVCLFSIAGSAAVWGGNNILLPAVKMFMPGEYALMMCLAKYGGNMQICVAQNQTVQVQKTGTYETLQLDLGAVTPSQTLPPANPIPDVWSVSNPYELPFTLSNKNTVGSVYDITIDDINVSASPFEDNRDAIYASRDHIINMPNYPIKPGGSVVLTSIFDRSFYSFLSSINLPNCNQYTYFQINVTTDQIGGGSAKFGLIDNDAGTGNQNFMYFFNPDVKTDTGPVDIYTYTMPFVIPVKSTSAFGVFIQIDNNGDGTLLIQNLTLVQASETQNNIIIETSCRSSDISGFTVEDCSGGQGKCINITNIPLIEKKNSVTIRCDGMIGTQPFIGKTTDLISVNSYYKYIQSFDEQIACIKDEKTIDTACGYLNETLCSSGSVCHWCDECNGQKLATHINCTAYTDCGYHCDNVNPIGQKKCGAECGSNSDCPSLRPYCTQDCLCSYPIV